MRPLKIKDGVPQRMDPTDQSTFEVWMARCDGILTRARGVSIYDLPDVAWRDMFDARFRPVRAVNRAIRYALAFD